MSIIDPSYNINLGTNYSIPNNTIIGSAVYGYGNGELNLSTNTEFQNLVKKVEQIQKSLCILEPNFELHEKFPALKEAYEYYKLIENLVYNEVKG